MTTTTLKRKARPYNSFETAQAQFDRVAELLDLDTATKELLRSPIREYSFAIPVHMDDGSVQVFRGFRVQHNDARGPCKGGIRFHPLETLDTVRFTGVVAQPAGEIAVQATQLVAKLGRLRGIGRGGQGGT